jgi:Tol biopolymer transport system component/C-terminal processing protease CtpA/Prc
MQRLSVASLVVVALVYGAQAAPAPLPSFAEPGISPDGSTIAFVCGGDIWEVAATGGDARLLVSHGATESRPLYAPDGKRVAFTSTRSGNGDVYVLALSTGDVTRLTFDDAGELVTGWSSDGKWIYFQTGSHELSTVLDVYRVGADGGTPMAVAADRYTTEYFAAPAPSGDGVAITARANAGSQWWRKGHSHLDESEIWIVRNSGAAAPAYTQITAGGAKDAWPMWSADGTSLYFMSDRSGAQNIWMAPAAAGAAKPLTTFRDGRVLWPTVSTNGKTIAFERDFGIWTMDTASAQVREVPVLLRGAPASTAVEHRTFSDQVQELALSPDAKKVTFTVHGEIFSASAKDGGDAARVTTTAGEEAELAWAPDSRRLAYMSDRDGTNHLFLYDFTTGKETPLTSGAGRDHQPRFSPDGKLIAFERDSRELRVIDPANSREQLIATGVFDTPPFVDARDFVWSPDSRFLAYLTVGSKTFVNVNIAAVAAGASPALKAGEGRAVSFLANTRAGSLAWAPDGTYLTFSTAQRTEPGDVIRVDLTPRTPKFREDQFRDLFKDEQPKTTLDPPRSPKTPDAPATTAPGFTPGTTPPAKTAAAGGAEAAQSRTAPSRPKPVDIVFEEIRRRASALPVGVDVSSQEISPDGKWLLLTGSAAGQQSLYVYPLDELSREPSVARQLTSTPGAKRSAQFTSDSKEVYYLDRGRVFNVTLEKREPKAVGVTAELDVDFASEKLKAFEQAWSYLRDQFFDERMNGVDWNAARATYEPRIAGSHTADEMRRLVALMLGELNASHMGISAPPQETLITLGRLAVDLDRVEYEKNGRLRLTSVVPLGPAALAGIKPGEYLAAVDGRAVGAGVNVDQLLDHTIGKRVALSVSFSATAPAREVVLKPVNLTTERGLRYRQWVEQKREYVAKASRGRLGYVHMFDMTAASLLQLHVDLDAENHARDGVVIDIRNNNGGFVNVYAIDVFARRGYFNMSPRGFPSVSSRTSLGQRALELPTILVTNQHSLSDAEDFTEGYRTLKLGKVVGEPTAGWIIYTGSVTLIDGSLLRIPATKILANDGTPMEMHPRPVDVAITRPVGESYSGKDTQLDTACTELLKQLGARPAKSTAAQ